VLSFRIFLIVQKQTNEEIKYIDLYNSSFLFLIDLDLYVKISTVAMHGRPCTPYLLRFKTERNLMLYNLLSYI
jgi:hypothetical protein